MASGTYDEQAGHADDEAGHGWRRRLGIHRSDFVLYTLEGEVLARQIAFEDVDIRMWRSSENIVRKSWSLDKTYGELLGDGSGALNGCTLKGEHRDIALRIVKESGRNEHVEQYEGWTGETDVKRLKTGTVSVESGVVKIGELLRDRSCVCHGELGREDGEDATRTVGRAEGQHQDRALFSFPTLGHVRMHNC